MLYRIPILQRAPEVKRRALSTDGSVDDPLHHRFERTLNLESDVIAVRAPSSAIGVLVRSKLKEAEHVPVGTHIMRCWVER